MAVKELRLRVDSPYPGESMSSFLSRAAQFYAMPVPYLLKSLLGSSKQSVGQRKEVDLESGSVLEGRLSETVRNWRSPAEDHKGFLGWKLAQQSRAAYCPACFMQDLAEGRTPYFRNDWIPVLVTTCWRHRTPLFDWEMTYTGGWRRWPREWLYGIGSPSEHVPAFMQGHLGQLDGLISGGEVDVDVGDGILASQAFAYLGRVQSLMEKPSAAPMPEQAGFRSDLDDFRCVVRQLVQLAAWYWADHRELPVATAVSVEGKGGWFSSLPERAVPRSWEYLDAGLRRDACIRWRRHYLMFVVRTLLRMDRFSSLFPLESPVLSSPDWRAWWSGGICQHLGPRQRKSLARFMDTKLV